jgi:hypothetical protein
MTPSVYFVTITPSVYLIGAPRIQYTRQLRLRTCLERRSKEVEFIITQDRRLRQELFSLDKSGDRGHSPVFRAGRPFETLPSKSNGINIVTLNPFRIEYSAMLYSLKS